MNLVDEIQHNTGWTFALILGVVLAAYGLFALLRGRLRRETTGQRFPFLIVGILAAAAAIVAFVIFPQFGSR